LSAPDSRSFTRVMLVDDHAIVREGYRSLLQKQDHLRVVAEAGDGADDYRVYKEARPDLVIMDVSMPGMVGWKRSGASGNGTARRASSSSPCTRVLPMPFRPSRRARAAL
jgi:DNA-binding NarL/FixJ family response regulator